MISATDADRLAELHQACLPGSLLGLLGPRTLGAYYRWIDRSAQDHLLVERESGSPVGAATLSLDPGSLMKRFARANLRRVGPAVLRGAVGSRPFRRGLRELLTPSVATAPATTAPEVVQLFTAPSARGRGVASRLLTQVEAILTQTGLTSYVVHTLRDGNEATLAFYAGRGFREVGAEDRGGETYLRLERRL